MLALDLFAGPYWRKVSRCDPRARALADRHYSRQTVGAVEFTPPGRVWVLLGFDERAVWAVCDNLDPQGARRFRCAIFRNEGVRRSSDLIKEATRLTLMRWRMKWPDHPPLETEIDPGRVRRKRDPGRCFRKAGWSVVEERRGLIVMRAPECLFGVLSGL